MIPVWKKIVSSHVSDKMTSRIYKEFLQLYNKKFRHFKHFNRHFPPKNI